MIEPAETESRETLDAFIAAMIEIARLAETDPEKLREAPTSTCVSRLDETAAARRPNIAYLPDSRRRPVWVEHGAFGG